MALVFVRLISMKMRRLSELLLLVFFVVIVVTIGSKWSLKPATQDNAQYIDRKINLNPVNSVLSAQASNLDSVRSVQARSDLPKYIHLDLKGAPPQSQKFYERFFSFIQKLQMGVKGFLIEYEDMLPLQGRFVNVRDIEIENLKRKYFYFRQHID